MNLNVAIGENVTKGESLGAGKRRAVRSDRTKTEMDRSREREEQYILPMPNWLCHGYF